MNRGKSIIRRGLQTLSGSALSLFLSQYVCLRSLSIRYQVPVAASVRRCFLWKRSSTFPLIRLLISLVAQNTPAEIILAGRRPQIHSCDCWEATRVASTTTVEGINCFFFLSLFLFFFFIFFFFSFRLCFLLLLFHRRSCFGSARRWGQEASRVPA